MIHKKISEQQLLYASKIAKKINVTKTNQASR